MIVFAVKTKDYGDEAFMLDLYQKYARLMYSTALRYVPDHQNCEDIVQDAVESLCGKILTLQSLTPQALPAYIVYTVKNKAINFLRHQAVVDRHTGELSDLEDCQSEDPSPESAAVLKEQMARLSEIWPQLPEDDQELLYRKYILGQTNGELAEIFHCQKESIRMKVTRARRKALSLMERSGGYVES